MTLTLDCEIAELPSNSGFREPESAERKSWHIAHTLSESCYEQYAEGDDTSLANATREYMCALQLAALDFEDVYDGLYAPHFMRSYHDNLSCDLYAV